MTDDHPDARASRRRPGRLVVDGSTTGDRDQEG